MISSVRTFLVDTASAQPKSFLFCRVETNDGTVGWGEAYAIPNRERGIAETIKALGELLMTLDDTTPQNFRSKVDNGFDEGHFSIDLSSAASALEVALWDIAGKKAGKPVCDLLGGVVRRSVPLYVTVDPLSPDETIEQLIERCMGYVRQGFSGVKIYPMEYTPLTAATDFVRRVRDAIGDDVQMMIDVWALDEPDEAIQAAKAFARFDPFWFEEPVAGTCIDELAQIRSAVDIPIVTGERQVGMHHYRSVLESKAADILNPDILAAGGMADMIEIGQLADSYGAKIAPHCWNSTLVGTAAMVHAMAVMPNAIVGEYFAHYAPYCDRLGQLQIEITGSHANIGDTLGLGVELDLSVLACYEV